MNHWPWDRLRDRRPAIRPDGRSGIVKSGPAHSAARVARSWSGLDGFFFAKLRHGGFRRPFGAISVSVTPPVRAGWRRVRAANGHPPGGRPSGYIRPRDGSSAVARVATTVKACHRNAQRRRSGSPGSRLSRRTRIPGGSAWAAAAKSAFRIGGRRANEEDRVVGHQRQDGLHVARLARGHPGRNQLRRISVRRRA